MNPDTIVKGSTATLAKQKQRCRLIRINMEKYAEKMYNAFNRLRIAKGFRKTVVVAFGYFNY